MAKLKFVSEVSATVEELYLFHVDFKNVRIVTPPIVKLRLLKVPQVLEEGCEMVIEITQMGFPILWDVKVETLRKNELLVDTQSGRGPFKYWRHEHIFESKGEKAVLIDNIEYQLPFGFIGVIVDLLIVQFMQKLMFSYRHRKTKEYFKKQ